MATDRIRVSAEDRRSMILEAGRHMFARKGYHGTGTAELAARAGVLGADPLQVLPV